MQAGHGSPEMSTDDAAAISRGYADVEVAVTRLLRGGAVPAMRCPELIRASLRHRLQVLDSGWSSLCRFIAELYVTHPDFQGSLRRPR